MTDLRRVQECMSGTPVEMCYTQKVPDTQAASILQVIKNRCLIHNEGTDSKQPEEEL